MKQENHPKEVRSNEKGANQDIDKEILGSNSKSGEYLEGRNLRLSSVRSNRSSAEKIKGEQIVHQNNQVQGYECICADSVNGQKIEFWVDRNKIEDPIIIIDGVIVAKSDKIPFLIDFPIQHDKNESCVGGEIFVTDNNTPPMIFNLKDMLDSLINNPTKYFADFNPSLYTVNLETPLSIPVFKELVNIGGSNGLPRGSYMYSFRYVTADGDRTDWTPSTPPIPVLESVSYASNTFPHVKTYGGISDTSNNTNFGIRIKFRVNNSSNFDFIEVRRQSYNNGLSGILTPDSFIIAKIDLFDGEISVKEFIDPVDSNVNDAISEEDEVNKLTIINRAKAIRYHDKRLVLMNVELDSKNIDDIEFIDINGAEGIPVVRNLYKDGHKDPHNHTYYKKYMGGEKYGFGIACFSSTGGSSFARPIPSLKNFEFPNRRDEVSADSKALSYLGTPVAANRYGNVTDVFEIFDLEDAVQKQDKCSFKNLINDDSFFNGGKSRSAVNSYGCPDPGFGAFVEGDEVGYQPYHPTSMSDLDVSGLDYRVNLDVDDGNAKRTYNPKGFAPNNYSLGLAIGGVTKLPSWVKGFSVVRTEAAGRVACQGIGIYSMIEGEFNQYTPGNTKLVTKHQNKLWFHSADLKLYDSSFIDDLKANPDDYEIQLVSALGFFSEMYNYNNVIAGGYENRDLTVDLVTYARILHDEGQINPNEHAGMGVFYGGKNYVAHSKYRNSNAPSSGAFAGDGNKVFTIASFSEVNDNGSVFFDIELGDSIYYNSSIGGTSNHDFQDTGLKEWTEPFYIVNIINKGAEVKDNNINNYKSTGHFQKIESIIGVGDSTSGQIFELVDERWEDCIPDLSSSGSFASLNSYLYMVNSLGISKAWMNVSFRSAIDVTNITNDIINNGFHVPEPGVQIYGLYTHTNSGNKNFDIVFNIANFFPTQDDFITVKYDERRPLIVFGGDTTIGESVFSPINKINNNELDFFLSADDPAGQYDFNAGFPFRRFYMNPRDFVLQDGSATFNKIQDDSDAALGYIRQLIVMFLSENRAAIHYAHSFPTSFNSQFFPQTNYVKRANRWDTADLSNNFVFKAEYESDYGLDEFPNWGYGGFKYNPSINIDYSYDGPIQYFSKPEFGFKEVTEFCTAVLWSLPRAINVQDSPGLKTFTNLNRTDIADDQGPIKKAYDATTGGKGENLYAITEKGVCLLLTKKAILSNIDANDLTTTASDTFVSGEYWISKQIGSNDEMWRGMGERSIGFITEGGMIEKEVLFFCNKQSVYHLVENQIKDIGRTGYYSRLKPFLDGLKPGYSGFLTGAINKNNNEFWLDIEDGSNGDRKLFVFGNENVMWEGYFDYSFDKYYTSKNKVYGVRDLQTFELEKGLEINGRDITFELTTVFSPANISIEKEFIRIGVQTGGRGLMKPTRIEFFDVEMNKLCSLSQFGQGTMFLKQYDSWEQFIGRKDASVSPNRDRLQERTVVVKIIHSEPEDFKVVTTTMQYKILK